MRVWGENLICYILICLCVLQVLYKDKVLGENVYFTVVDSIQYTSTTSGESGNAVDVVECLLASVEVRQGENKYPVNRTILTWITLTKGKQICILKFKPSHLISERNIKL